MDLIERIKQGDETAMGELVKQELPKIYNLSLRLCRNPQDAHDLCQDAFVKAVQYIKKFRGDAKVSTWLYRITVNTWKNRVRSEKRRHFSSHFSINNNTYAEDGEARDFDLESPELSPDYQAEKNEAAREVYISLNKLDPDEKSIVVLKDVENKSYEEIADVLDLNIGTVKSRLSRARTRLREIHLRRGGKVL